MELNDLMSLTESRACVKGSNEVCKSGPRVLFLWKHQCVDHVQKPVIRSYAGGLSFDTASVSM